MRSPRIVAQPTLVVAVSGPAAGGSGDTTNNTNPGTDRATDGDMVIQADPGTTFKPTISIGSKTFTQEFVLVERRRARANHVSCSRRPTSPTTRIAAERALSDDLT